MASIAYEVSAQGSQVFRDLIAQIAAVNERSKDHTGDLLYAPVALLIEAALSDPRTRSGVVLALAEFVASAVDGNVITP